MKSSISFETRLPARGISVFSQIDALAEKHHVVDLWQGAPDYPAGRTLIDYAVGAMRAGFNQYSVMPGVIALRRALTDKIRFLYGATYSPETEITITAGASEAIFATIVALVNPGDEVIFFEPAFDLYEPIVRLQGAKPIPMRISLEHLKIDWDRVAAAVTPRTRMIVINTPHNPTGLVLEDTDVEALAAITAQSNIIVLSDEVYEHVVFDGMKHLSMCRYPELTRRSVVVFSLGKTYDVTGWRIGYCVAPADLMAEIRKIHRYLAFSAPTPLQMALAEEVSNPETYLKLSGFYEKKRDILKKALSESRLRLMPTHGGFFMLASFRHFTAESDVDFAKRLMVEVGVGTVPMSAFYSDRTDTGMIRLSFCKDDETLLNGGRRLSNGSAYGPS
jgi:aspartate/methionine/tyrosine aminotransferase